MRKNIILVGEPMAIEKKIMVLWALRKDWLAGGVNIMAKGRNGCEVKRSCGISKEYTVKFALNHNSYRDTKLQV
jgi:hypothetical protein